MAAGVAGEAVWGEAVAVMLAVVIAVEVLSAAFSLHMLLRWGSLVIC
jgi:hypothetical protein